MHTHHPQTEEEKSNGSFGNQKSNKDPPSLPLTNRNLQTLIRRSSTIEDPISPTAVAIDIDKFTNEQRLFAKSNTWQDHYEDRDDEQYSYSEFGESNPSSEHSSDSTSLDDVCFPDFREDVKTTSAWPDLHVLEEFIKEELEEVQTDLEPTVNFGGNVVHSENEDATESTPLIDSFKVNEVESLGLENNPFQIRPTPIQPWERSQQNIPPILKDVNKGKLTKRFAGSLISVKTCLKQYTRLQCWG